MSMSSFIDWLTSSITSLEELHPHEEKSLMFAKESLVQFLAGAGCFSVVSGHSKCSPFMLPPPLT